ncbi:MAG: ABC transporter permease subunit [Alphaproteobacteria bacterium]|nr:ABC transporter permease subunit [Alphaproteobacteria bacterium]
MLKQINLIFQKEFCSFFRTRLAYFVLGIYLFLSMFCTFYLGLYFDVINTGLFSFFYFQVNILMLVVPALTMRLWADEYKTGSIELLLTRPLSYTSVVIGKFLAAWGLCLLMLVCTFPLWLYTAAALPADNLNIAASYFGCFLISGSMCAVGCMVSAFNKSPIVAYLGSVLLLTLLIIVNYNFIFNGLNLSGSLIIRFTQSLNFFYHQSTLLNGQLGLDNIIYYASITVLTLWLNRITIEYKRS